MALAFIYIIKFHKIHASFAYYYCRSQCSDNALSLFSLTSRSPHASELYNSTVVFWYGGKEILLHHKKVHYKLSWIKANFKTFSDASLIGFRFMSCPWNPQPAWYTDLNFLRWFKMWIFKPDLFNSQVKWAYLWAFILFLT